MRIPFLSYRGLAVDIRRCFVRRVEIVVRKIEKCTVSGRTVDARSRSLRDDVQIMQKVSTKSGISESA
jgi:hypothetical protein